MQKHLNQLLATRDFDEKIARGKAMVSLAAQPVTAFISDDLKPFATPSRPDGFCVVAPRNVPKRDFSDTANRVNFLHAIANIELLAIELPALCLARFGSDDADFIATQLKIIAEEARHFELLRDRLRALGCEFGTIPVHHGLWDWAWRCTSELEHQVIIPCYLEARGLDVTPEFVIKLRDAGDAPSATIMQIIVDEEVGHVRAGMDYLHRTALKQGTCADALFEQVLRSFFGDRLKSKVPLNPKIRKLAGFSEAQIGLLR